MTHFPHYPTRRTPADRFGCAMLVWAIFVIAWWALIAWGLIEVILWIRSQ